MSFFRYFGAVGVLGQGRRLQIVQIPRRWKKTKKKWMTVQTTRKSEPSFHALRHFDDNYHHQFGSSWPSIRLGLLSNQKYGALINNYAIPEETEALLATLGAREFVQPAAVKLEKIMMDQRSLVESSDSDDLTDSSSDSEAENITPTSNASNDHDFNHPGHFSPLDKPNDERQAPDKRPQWEEKYIVTPGYETKMEYLMSSDASIRYDVNSPLPIPPTDIDVVERPLSIGKHLKCFVFDDGNVDRFPPSKMDSRGIFLQYYAMDAASILPVIALDVEAEDVVLDMCAAPGGKTLAIIQTMLAGGVVANEPESARRRRLTNVLKLYIGYDRRSSQDVRLTAEDGCSWGKMEPDTYDKVLVDVPCTTDRLSANNNTNSIFAVNRTSERWELPKLQTDLLCAALQAVKPGGDVVYSTCSLSLQQNAAVVQSALYQSQTENMEVVVVDLSPLTQCLGHVFKFCDTPKYGELVLPNVRSNFGPMYFCKLHRVI